MSDNGYINAAALLALARMDVECPDGRKYRIRKIDPAEMASLGGGIDLTVYLKRQRENKEPTEDEAEALLKFQNAVVVAGVCSLDITHDDAGDINVRDLPQEDKDLLLPRILVFSKLSKEEAEKLRPLSPTPESSSA